MKYALVLILILSSCSSLKTPEDKYLALTTSASIATSVAQNYVDDCKVKPKVDPCYRKFPAINTAAKATLKAKAQADRVFITKDSEYYDLSLSTLENTINDLTILITEK